MNSGSPPGYDPRDFPSVAVTVDVVLFGIQEGELNVLLVEREVDPFRGDWALPGGFVQPDDADLHRTASRELAEKTGVGAGAAYLEQLATYGDMGWDPRMRVVSVAYWAACAELPATDWRERCSSSGASAGGTDRGRRHRAGLRSPADRAGCA